MNRLDEKKDTNTYCLKEVNFLKRHILVKSKRIKTIHYTNTNHKKAGMAI